MRQVIAIEPEWLVEIAPHYYKAKDIAAGEGEGGGGRAKMPKGAGRGAAAVAGGPDA